MKQPLSGELDVSRETTARLDIYVALLRRWSPRINLVSRADLDHLWPRHVMDSLQLLPLLPPGCERAIDLGSGGGFPAIPLAVAGGMAFDLVESDRRKCAFLREAARETGAPVRVHAMRAEDAARPGGLAPAGLVTARALAPLDGLLGLAAPLLAPGGTCRFLKGANAAAELTAAAARWQMQATSTPSRTRPDAAILTIRAPRPHDPHPETRPA